MTGQDLGTEQLIKDTAKHIFFVDGRLNATTQEIADEAGVNRSLVHYYFRSRDLLFSQVYHEAMTDIRVKLTTIFATPLPFREKVECFLETFLEHVRATPFLEVFLIAEINNRLCHNKRKEGKAQMSPEMLAFLDEVAVQMEQGTIQKMKPVNFLINLFALISHPIIMKPLYLESFGIPPEEYEALLNERKALVLQLIFNSPPA